LNTYPYWWDTVSDARLLELAPAGAHLSPSASCDVAILGAGYTGLSAALALARSGASVLVLERERAGWGASSRNGGQVITGLKLDASTLVAHYGARRAREMFGASLEAMAFLESLIDQEHIACEYARCGHIQAACKPAHFDAFREEQRLLAEVFSHHVTLVARADQASELGAQGYYGLLVDERSAAINPALYVHGLAQAASRAGACLLEHADVTTLSRAGTGWVVRTTLGDVRAKDVFIATNGYTGEATPALRRRLIPIGSYIIATRPLDRAVRERLIPRQRVVFDSKNFLYYFRLTADHRLLFGGRAEFTTRTAETEKRAAAILEQGIKALFPDLGETLIDYAWGGNVAFTRDQMPHAGRLDGAYFAGGYCGHGIAMATYLGSLMARRIAGETLTHPLLDTPFPPIPLYDGRPWFLPLVGAYYRFRDWVA
jgi:glycine/D-amino acid oxidase-like deaminating enzyme